MFESVSVLPLPCPSTILQWHPQSYQIQPTTPVSPHSVDAMPCMSSSEMLMRNASLEAKDDDFEAKGVLIEHAGTRFIEKTF